MQRFDQEHGKLQIYRFRLTFQDTGPLDIELSGYLCDVNGSLLEGADVWQEELQLAATAEELARGSLLIVPYSTDVFTGSQLSEQALMAHHAFKPTLTLEAGRYDYLLPAIPKPVWRQWLEAVEPGRKRDKVSNSDFLFF